MVVKTKGLLIVNLVTILAMQFTDTNMNESLIEYKSILLASPPLPPVGWYLLNLYITI